MLNLTTEEKKTLESIINRAMNDVGLLRGEYDHKNGNQHFMYGINTAIEYFAFLVSEEFGEEVSKKFIENMIKGEEEK